MDHNHIQHNLKASQKEPQWQDKSVKSYQDKNSKHSKLTWRFGWTNIMTQTTSTTLSLKNASKKWTMPIKNWPLALNQFEILCGEYRHDLKDKKFTTYTN